MLVKQLHLQQSNTELSCLIQILCFRIWIPSAQANTSQHRTFRNFQGACQEVLKATKYVTRLTPQLLESSGEVHQLLSTKDSHGFFWILLHGDKSFPVGTWDFSGQTPGNHIFCPPVSTMNENTLFQGCAWCSPLVPVRRLTSFTLGPRFPTHCSSSSHFIPDRLDSHWFSPADTLLQTQAQTEQRRGKENIQ